MYQLDPVSPIHVWLLLTFSGSDVFSCNSYFVSVQKQILSHDDDEITEFLSAVQVMFSCYYVFNVEYNPACVATLQR